MADDKNTIIIGDGDTYMTEFTGTEIPKDEEIETSEKCVGHCHAGFSIEYKPTKYEVKNQYNKTIRSFITKEEITAKTGIISWNLNNLNLLSTAKITEDTSKKERTLIFGGNGSLKTVLVRFVHTNENGKKLRFTMIGQGGNGFNLKFGEKELTVDSEITAIEYIKNFLAEFREEI